jgi:hypothetical protein
MKRFQFGLQQLLPLTERSARVVNHKKATGAVFLDVEKGID